MKTYTIKYTARYKKSLKKLGASGRKKDIAKLNMVINILARGKLLAEKHKDHCLSGKPSHIRECHIKNDLLLMYTREESELLLVLVDVGSHDLLFG